MERISGHKLKGHVMKQVSGVQVVGDPFRNTAFCLSSICPLNVHRI